MKLTTREKTELWGEGIFTLVLLLLLNLSVIILLNQAFQNNPGLRLGMVTIKRSLIGWHDYQSTVSLGMLRWENLFIIVLGFFDITIIYWRLLRRHRLMELNHIIDELHYIAHGHFNHRIPFQVNGESQRVVDSVNLLVDNVIKSIKEERSIEHSKDEMITNVSHDIRTPLTSIIGYLGLIEMKDNYNKGDVQDFVHIAYLKSKQMKSLADDLFEYTKVRQTDMSLKLNNIDINQLLEQLAANSNYDAKKENMNVITKTMPNDVKIEADASQLGRVFNNLIANALKYGNNGKNIYLSAKQLSSKEVVLKVSNDGDPIPKEALKQIFNRFYRAEKSRNQKTGGTGLGLAIVQSIIDHHNGYIKVDSNDKLTTFAIHLPIRHNEPLKRTGFKRIKSSKEGK